MKAGCDKYGDNGKKSSTDAGSLLRIVIILEG
jgi:hypothetical protein